MPKDTSLIRTELFAGRGVPIRGGLLYIVQLLLFCLSSMTYTKRYVLFVGQYVTTSQPKVLTVPVAHKNGPRDNITEKN